MLGNVKESEIKILESGSSNISTMVEVITGEQHGPVEVDRISTALQQIPWALTVPLQYQVFKHVYMSPLCLLKWGQTY